MHHYNQAKFCLLDKTIIPIGDIPAGWKTSKVCTKIIKTKSEEWQPKQQLPSGWKYHQKRNKTIIPIGNIPAGWKTSLAKPSKFQNLSSNKQVDNQ